MMGLDSNSSTNQAKAPNCFLEVRACLEQVLNVVQIKSWLDVYKLMKFIGCRYLDASHEPISYIREHFNSSNKSWIFLFSLISEERTVNFHSISDESHSSFGKD